MKNYRDEFNTRFGNLSGEMQEACGEITFRLAGNYGTAEEVASWMVGPHPHLIRSAMSHLENHDAEPVNKVLDQLEACV